MKYTEKSFQVAGHRCFGCEQRDTWIEQKEQEIDQLKQLITSLKDDLK